MQITNMQKDNKGNTCFCIVELYIKSIWLYLFPSSVLT